MLPVTILTVLSVQPSRRPDRYEVTLLDGQSLSVTGEDVLHYRLRVGRTLDGNEWEALTASARLSSVKAQAAELLNRRPLSRRELEQRLQDKGASEGDIQAAADWLEEIGVLDDRRYAASLVRHYGARGYGAGRIREELRRRGISRELWEAAGEELPDSREILDELIRKKTAGGLDLRDRREARRLTDYLLRRGFSWEEIRAALKRAEELV